MMIEKFDRRPGGSAPWTPAGDSSPDPLRFEAHFGKDPPRKKPNATIILAVVALHAAVLTAVIEWPGHAVIERRFHEIKVTIVADHKTAEPSK